MTSIPVLPIIQLVAIMLCAAVALGLLLSTMLVRGRLHMLGSEGPLHDLVFTERTYVAAATFCGAGAIAAIGMSWGGFATFMLIGASFLVADQYILPRMREAIAAGLPIPMSKSRARFELLAGTCLAVLFWKTAVPPLVALTMVYGIG